MHEVVIPLPPKDLEPGFVHLGVLGKQRSLDVSSVEGSLESSSPCAKCSSVVRTDVRD
jgi:hypothetical protein